jgi:hypothetical protein
MAYACDMCLRVSYSHEIAVLSGWWGREEVSPATARKAPSYRRVLLETEAKLEGHICRRCVETHLSEDIRLNAEKPRAVLRAERRAAFPQESAFTNLRKSMQETTEVLCDRFEAKCFDRHVELSSAWVDEEQAQQVAHLCDRCYELHLVPTLVAKAGALADIVEV